MRSPTTDADLDQRVETLLLAQVIRRCTMISYVGVCLFPLLGIIILPNIRRADPSITLWNNLWPRFFLNTIPWLLLSQFLSRSKVADRWKLITFVVVQGIIFDVTALIYVWPLTLKGNPFVLLHVNGLNTQYFIYILLVMAAPLRFLAPILGSFGAVVLLPLFYVAYHSGDTLVATTIVGDSLTAVLAGCASGILMNQVYSKVMYLSEDRSQKAASFLGKQIHAAIFEDKKEILEEEVTEGLVLFLDVRDSSRLTNELGAKWSTFISEWMNRAPDVIRSHHGTLLKTGGDSLLVTFGVFDENVDLSDIPGLERDLQDAEERRWTSFTKRCLGCCDQLVSEFYALARRHGLESNLRLGMGVDRGRMWKGVRGSEARRELDIWGGPVNCASRLEAFSKTVSSRFSAGSSILVLSPYSTDYLQNMDGFVKIATDGRIRDFDGIQWVLVKEYPAASIRYSEAA